MEKKLAVVIPMTPNFIKVGKQVIPINEFTAEELKNMGRREGVRWLRDKLLSK